MSKLSLALAVALVIAAGLASTAEARGKRYVPHTAAAPHGATLAPQPTTATQGAIVVARRLGKR